MLKHFAVAVAAATAFAVAAPAAPAMADTPNCVSKAEFRKAKKGMTRTKVHRIFDVSGRRDAISTGGGYSFEIRSYNACTQFGVVSIGYEKRGGGSWKLSNKVAVW